MTNKKRWNDLLGLIDGWIIEMNQTWPNFSNKQKNIYKKRNIKTWFIKDKTFIPPPKWTQITIQQTFNDA